MKRIKSISLIIISIAISFLVMPRLNALTGGFKVSSNRTSVVVGDTFTVTVNVFSSDTLGSWEYTINYDSSKLKLIDPHDDVSVLDSGDGKTKNMSYKYTFKAIATGSSSISVKSYAIINFWSYEKVENPSTSSVRISAITQAELEASYSKNNNLSSISVDKGSLDPEFDKNTLEYNVKVPSDTEKITLDGKVEDRTATVSGLGEFDVTEGDNKFEIKVTAQNGSVKTYTVNVSVEDLNPIIVKIDGKDYSVIKRASALTGPNTYQKTEIEIEGNRIPAFVSDITKFTLVGLKDSEGKSNLYVYNNEKNTYILYKEITTNGIILYPTNTDEIPKYYELSEITINGEKIKAYKEENNNDYYLIHGINIENNEEAFYMYDVNNNSLIKYNNKLINELIKRNDNFLLIIIVLTGETIVVTMILLISFTKRNKKRKKAIKKTETEKEKSEDKELL